MGNEGYVHGFTGDAGTAVLNREVVYGIYGTGVSFVHHVVHLKWEQGDIVNFHFVYQASEAA